MNSSKESIDGPNNSSWSIILRKKDDNQVVLYNEDQKRIIVQAKQKEVNPKSSTTTLMTPGTIQSVCSLCKRPIEEKAVVSYMDSNYFRFLDETFREETELDLSLNSGSGLDDLLSSIRHIPKAAFNQGYYGRFFREGRRLGRGAHGAVFLAQHILQGEMLGEYAVKKVPVGDDSEWLQRMLREVHVMESLRHPNTVAYKHTWLEIHKTSNFGPPVPCLFILMEYANGGNLEDYVTADVIDMDPNRSRFKLNSGPTTTSFLPIEDVISIFLGISRGMEHLHYFGIIHRDLKPSNILLHYPADQVTRPVVLISDFGECNMADDLRRDRERTGATGTIEFCAPELFKVGSKGNYLVQHSTMTDSWSLGMMLYYLLFGGSLPFKNIDNVELLRSDLLALKRIFIPNIRKDIPSDLIELLKSLLALEPIRRPTASQVVKVMGVIASQLRMEFKVSPSLDKWAMIPRLTGPKPKFWDRSRPSIIRVTKSMIVFNVLFVGLSSISWVCYPQAVSWKILIPLIICLAGWMFSIIPLFMAVLIFIPCLVIQRVTLGTFCAC